MKGIVTFLGGVLVGTLLFQAAGAQVREPPRRLNHIGVTTRHYEESLAFYKKAFGAKEAFTVRREDGSVRLTYLQLSRDTFVELIAVQGEQPGGVVHFGVDSDDVAASVANLRASGMTVADPAVGFTKSRIGRVTDPNGVQIEVMEFGPESMQRKAIDDWK